MNKLLKPKNTPLLMLVSGGAGLFLQWLLYETAVDAKGLLISHHPVEIALWLLSAGALALAVSVSVNMDGVRDYSVNFPPSPVGAAGQFIMAAGVLVTVLTRMPVTGGTLGAAWWWLGIAAALALLWIGYCRFLGKAACFGVHFLVCAFLTAHILTHYQLWSGTPQLQNYVFHMLGAIALLLFAYYQMAFSVDMGMRRMLLGVGFMAIYLCTVALADTRFPELYVCGILWVWTSLCRFDVPREKVEL